MSIILRKYIDAILPRGTGRRKIVIYIYLLSKDMTPKIMYLYNRVKISFFLKNRYKLSRNNSATLFSLDRINDYWFHNLNKKVNVLYKSGSFALSGWAIDSCSATIADWVFIQIDNKLFRADYKQSRPDVAHHFNNPNYRLSGYSCLVDTIKISPGEHEVRLIVVINNWSEYYDINTSRIICLDSKVRPDYLNIYYAEFPRLKRYFLNLERKEAFFRFIQLIKFLRVIEKWNNNNKKLTGNYQMYPLSSVKQYCIKNDVPYIVKSNSKKTKVYAPHYLGDENDDNTVSVNQPEIYIAQLHNVSITGESSVIISDDGRLLFDMGQHPEVKRYNFRDNVLIYADRKNAVVSCFPDDNKMIIEKGVMLSGTASRNYFHWIFEFITRLSLFTNEAQYQDYPLIVDEAVLSVPQMSEALNLYSGGRDIISIKQNVKYKIENLVVPSYLTWIPLNIRKKSALKSTDTVLSTEGIKFIRNRMNDTVGKSYIKEKRRKIFLSRQSVKTDYRVLLNEDEVVQAFKGYGFEIIYPENMSFLEQYECFSTASVIAGATGAGMTNIVFAPEYCKIICLINKRIDFSVYSTIAGVIGQKMVYIAGNHISNEFQSSFNVDINDIAKCMKQLEISEN